MSIILFGGTFDPIHNAHLHIAERAYQAILPYQLIFIPCGKAVHRPPAIASDAERITLLRLALSDRSHCSIDPIEIERAGSSYAIATIKIYAHRYPEHALFWLMGTDTFQHFKSWRSWQEILNLSHLIVVERPNSQYDSLGFDLIDIDDRLPAAQAKKNHGHIFRLKTQMNPISASRIRNCLQQRHNTIDGLPQAVLDYIQRNGLYG